MLVYVPLVVAVVILTVVALTPLSRRADRVVNRVAWTLFSGANLRMDSHRERDLRAAGIGTPYRLYAVKTYLYTAVGAALLIGSWWPWRAVVRRYRSRGPA